MPAPFGGPLRESIDAAQRTVLEVVDLDVQIPSDNGVHHVVGGVSLSCRSGRTLAVVGESGSGKTMTFLTAMGLLPAQARVAGGSILLHGDDILRLGAAARRRLRGNKIAMIFQDALTGLSPSFTVGQQIADVFRHHRSMSRRDARRHAAEVLDMVRVPDAKRRLDQYPHELSGGLRQRVMIGMGVALQPDVLIADEPTTALDVTVQEQVLDLLQSLRDELGMSLVLITHDLGLVARYADDVAVMYAGRVVERGTVGELFEASRHPYTVALRRAIPRPDVATARLEYIAGHPPPLNALPPGCAFAPRCFHAHGRERCTSERPPLVAAPAAETAHVTACHFAAELADVAAEPVPLVEPGGPQGTTPTTAEAAEVMRVDELSKVFRSRAMLGRHRHEVRAVDGVSFSLHRGETLGLVGESGCGKSTLSRMILGLETPTSGTVHFAGTEATDPGRDQHIQIVFQDPYASLDPRQRIRNVLAEPLRAAGVPKAARTARVNELLELIGMSDEHGERYPHQFSGGQRQRIGVARSVAATPELLVLDEPVSALDVSIQAQILNTLADLRDELGLSYLLISHDLSVIRQVTDRIIVMYLGQIVEQASTAELYARPLHPYTEVLLSAAPIPDPVTERSRERIRLHGSLSTHGAPASGCALHPRCPRARAMAAAGHHAVEIDVDGRVAVPTRCVTDRPPLEDRGEGHLVACHFVDEALAVPVSLPVAVPRS